MFRVRVFRDVLVGGAMLAFAAPVFAAPPSAKAQYDHCLARAATNGNDALREATLWQESGGGPAADHCMAVALVTLHRYGEAATKLDALARGGFASDPAMRAALFDQAGNAWLLADNPDSAITSFTAALAIDPSDADLLADRARANAVKKLWARADSDLSAALLVDPDRADLLVLRGSARHAMGRKAEARADFEGALKIRPGLADALVERGMMKLESGDVAGARADWSQVVAAAPGTVAGEAARRHLLEIEAAAKPVGKKPKPAPKAR
jgi:tetratricopeptide (TPR) repeat protein